MAQLFKWLQIGSCEMPSCIKLINLLLGIECNGKHQQIFISIICIILRQMLLYSDFEGIWRQFSGVAYYYYHYYYYYSKYLKPKLDETLTLKKQMNKSYYDNVLHNQGQIRLQTKPNNCFLHCTLNFINSKKTYVLKLLILALRRENRVRIYSKVQSPDKCPQSAVTVLYLTLNSSYRHSLIWQSSCN